MGEIDRHTFNDVGPSHVNDGVGIAMTKAAMPSLDIRNARGIES